MRKRGKARRFDHDKVRELLADNSVEDVARLSGYSAIYVRILERGERPADRKTKSRFAQRPLRGRAAKGMPAFDNAAIMGGHTLFPARVFPSAGRRILKSAHNSAKIGAEILKGKWKGFPVYTLTLEERATCPQSCKHWRSCYGNSSQMAERIDVDSDFERGLVAEVARYSEKHRDGFAVRLHVLGDFYSVRYVQLWQAMLEQFPNLYAFGFSARWDCKTDPIARELVALVMANWDRFAIRFSNAPIDECATVSIEHPYQNPPDAIICPEQLGKTESCSTCGLCWQSRRRISFIQH